MRTREKQLSMAEDEVQLQRTSDVCEYAATEVIGRNVLKRRARTKDCDVLQREMLKIQVKRIDSRDRCI